MWVAGQTEENDSRGEVKTQEKLDRALVAGLILEVVLDPNRLTGLSAGQTATGEKSDSGVSGATFGRTSLFGPVSEPGPEPGWLV